MYVPPASMMNAGFQSMFDVSSKNKLNQKQNQSQKHNQAAMSTKQSRTRKK